MTFTCEWCGKEKSGKSLRRIAGHKICAQCNRRKKDNIAPKIKKFFTWNPIKKERLPFKREEKETLEDKYSKQGLSEEEARKRLTGLGERVKQQRNIRLASKREEKKHPNFKKGFTELTRRKS